MENKMDRDGDMSAHDGMTQGTDTESDDGATTDMAMDRPNMGMEDSTPNMGMEDTAPAMDDVGDGTSMEPTMHPASDMGSRKWGWLRRLTRRS